MDFGVIFLSHVESYKDVALAESQGFSHAWFGDSQMVWADVYQCMALCAANTTTIKMGTNVTNPSSRIAPVGPKCLEIRELHFDAIHLLADRAPKQSRRYREWLEETILRPAQ